MNTKAQKNLQAIFGKIRTSPKAKPIKPANYLRNRFQGAKKAKFSFELKQSAFNRNVEGLSGGTSTFQNPQDDNDDAHEAELGEECDADADAIVEEVSEVLRKVRVAVKIPSPSPSPM